jgi:hypothetical protein
VAQPPAYNRLASFTNLETANPDRQPPGASLDGGFNRVKATLDATLNPGLIQRDDDQLKNASGGRDQLTPEVSVGFYRCMGAQIADTFVTSHIHPSSSRASIL